MRTPFPTSPLTWATLVAAALLAGCSTLGNLLPGDKTDYRSESRQTSGLEVPPDLTQLAREGRYQAPASVVSANAANAAAPAANAAPAAQTVALSSAGDATLKRDGDLRWLAVNQPPERLWEQVRTFWLESGFTLAVEEPKIGAMETDWAENRAKLPKDLFRDTVGKLIDNLWDTGTRDRFRTRIERTPTGSEIFIAHRGLAEVYASGALKDDIRWALQPADHQLEAEFLSRLMVRLGSPADAARVALATPSPETTARARLLPGQTTATLEVNEGFDRAWRRVGLTLDRTGFTVEDRNRADGFYYVRYVAGRKASDDQRGLFSRLFGSDDEAGKAERYRIAVKGTGETSIVAVQTADGQPVPAEVGQRIAGVLLNDLK
ncbi:MAG: outer membrane protein assembly factor BamC [Rubrivivax sp.]